MKSILDGLADTTFRTITTDLLYVGSNDIQYEDIKGDMASKLGYFPQKFPLTSFRGSPFQEKMTAGDNPQLVPADQVNITEFYNKSLSSFKENEENIQCGENFMDIECFMVLNPSQQLAIAVLSLTLGTFTVLENLLVLCVILHSRSLRCRPSYHFIGSLAVADLLGSVIFVYSFIDFHVFHRKDSRNVFLFKLGGVTASFTASVGSLFLTAIDRYISIHRPLAYKRIVTRPKAVVAFCLMWTIAIVIAVLPLLGWNCEKLQSVCSDIFPHIDETYLMFWIGVTSVLLLFIVYAYMYILWKAHSHAVRMIQRGTQKSIIIHTSEDGKVQVTRPDQARMDIRLAKTLVLILVVLIICWGPLLAIMVYDVFGKMNKLIKTVFAFCSMLCLLNSTVNPIIYALRSKDLRHAFRSMFPSCEGTAQPLDNSMGDSDCLHKHANNTASVHRAAESCIKSTVKIAKVTMSVSTDTSAEAL
uniref:Cannabinoid receptor 1 n=1 Tax=Chlorocebus sabaeus TaxID=60711 RepID=A0A0D9SAB2_CHLSB